MFLLALSVVAEIVGVLSHLQNILLIQICYFQSLWRIVFPCQVVFEVKGRREEQKENNSSPSTPTLYT